MGIVIKQKLIKRVAWLLADLEKDKRIKQQQKTEERERRDKIDKDKRGEQKLHEGISKQTIKAEKDKGGGQAHCFEETNWAKL